MGDTYRFVGSNHYHDGEHLEPGDVVELSDGEVESFGHKFEAVSVDSDGDTDTTDTGDTAADTDEFDADAFFAQYDHWREAVTAIEDGEADGYLDELRDAEEARDSPRDSVLSAIDERAGQ